MINRQRISCRHLVTFNMDEYADEQGRTAPADWEGSFATSMRQSFFDQIDPDLRPLDDEHPLPHRSQHRRLLEADRRRRRRRLLLRRDRLVWPHRVLGVALGPGVRRRSGRLQTGPRTHRRAEPDDDHAERAAHVHAATGRWVPPQGGVHRPARDPRRARPQLLAGRRPGRRHSWQRFIARLVAHGPVNELVPGSILQETNCGYHILGGVADDVRIDFS